MYNCKLIRGNSFLEVNVSIIKNNGRNKKFKPIIVLKLSSGIRLKILSINIQATSKLGALKKIILKVAREKVKKMYIKFGMFFSSLEKEELVFIISNFTLSSII